MSAFVLASVVALVICLITFFVFPGFWGVRVNNRAKMKSQVASADRQSERCCPDAEKRRQGSDIRIGDLPIIRDSEIQNFCCTAQSGPVSRRLSVVWPTTPSAR